MWICCFVECQQFTFLCIIAYAGTDINMKQVACPKNSGALFWTKNPLFFLILSTVQHSNIQLIGLKIAVCSVFCIDLSHLLLQRLFWLLSLLWPLSGCTRGALAQSNRYHHHSAHGYFLILSLLWQLYELYGQGYVCHFFSYLLGLVIGLCLETDYFHNFGYFANLGKWVYLKTDYFHYFGHFITHKVVKVVSFMKYILSRT